MSQFREPVHNYQEVLESRLSSGQGTEEVQENAFQGPRGRQ